MKELLAAGRAPLEVTRFSPMAGGGSAIVGPRFQIGMKNPSDKKIESVRWTAFFYDEAGKPLAAGAQDGGYAELEGIGPGEEVEGMMTVPAEARRGRVVLRSVVYETLPPGAEDNETMRHMKIDLQWKNPRADEEAAAAAQGP